MGFAGGVHHEQARLEVRLKLHPALCQQVQLDAFSTGDASKVIVRDQAVQVAIDPLQGKGIRVQECQGTAHAVEIESPVTLVGCHRGAIVDQADTVSGAHRTAATGLLALGAQGVVRTLKIDQHFLGNVEIGGNALRCRYVCTCLGYGSRGCRFGVRTGRNKG